MAPVAIPTNRKADSSIAGLYTLIATCEAPGVNPLAYLADVIAHVQDHPEQRLDELLPGVRVQAKAAWFKTSKIGRLLLVVVPR
jgi:hypothetical protein